MVSHKIYLPKVSWGVGLESMNLTVCDLYMAFNLLGHHCFLFLVTFFVVNVLFLHHSYPQNSSFLSFMYLGCGRLNLWNWISKFYIWHFIIHLFIHFLAIVHTFMGKSGTDRQQTNSNFINIDSITFPVFRLEQGGTVVSIFNWEQFNKDAVSLFTMCRQISPLNRNYVAIGQNAAVESRDPWIRWDTPGVTFHAAAHSSMIDKPLLMSRNYKHYIFQTKIAVWLNFRFIFKDFLRIRTNRKNKSSCVTYNVTMFKLSDVWWRQGDTTTQLLSHEIDWATKK